MSIFEACSTNIAIISLAISFLNFLAVAILGYYGLRTWKEQHIKTEKYKAACKFSSLLHEFTHEIYFARNQTPEKHGKGWVVKHIDKEISNFLDKFELLVNSFIELSPIINNPDFNNNFDELRRITGSILDKMDIIKGNLNVLENTENGFSEFPGLKKQVDDLSSEFFVPQKSYLLHDRPDDSDAMGMELFNCIEKLRKHLNALLALNDSN
ncbi:MAG: hypothetical protein K8R77_07220 [Anaerolineaceae bacterium]|nr:hypothetical protein [Anaerolineaceae bacterium]